MEPITITNHPPSSWADYATHFAHNEYWQPLLAAISKSTRADVHHAHVASPSGTYPTFTTSQLLIKCYSRWADGQVSWQTEQCILSYLTTYLHHPMSTARLLTADTIDLAGQSYYYLIQTRLSGSPFSNLATTMPTAAQTIIASQLGQWLGTLHRLPLRYLPTQLPTSALDYPRFLTKQRVKLSERLDRRQHFPEALAGQADEFITRWLPESSESVLVHGDLHHQHALGQGQPWQLTSVIDFSDARLADPRYDLAVIATGFFHPVTSVLLNTLLDAYGWPKERSRLPYEILATALLHEFDLFARLEFPSDQDQTLEALAESWFPVS